MCGVCVQVVVLINYSVLLLLSQGELEKKIKINEGTVLYILYI